MGMVKASTLQMNPCGVGETIEKTWASCIESMDESCQRIIRKDRTVQAGHTETIIIATGFNNESRDDLYSH